MDPLHTSKGQRDDRQPLWPERFIELARGARAAGDPRSCEAARTGVWVLLGTVLRQNLRRQAHRYAAFSREDLEDLAAEKALELVLKFDRGGWRPESSTAGELVEFLKVVARNGIVDHWRRRQRVMVSSEDVADRGTSLQVPAADNPDVGVERLKFVEALLDCARALQERQRTIWFFRVFYDMQSKHIAAHPEVALRADHVDVILQRCRKCLRDCMIAHGFEVTDMPPGTFTALWCAFRRGACWPAEDPHGG